MTRLTNAMVESKFEELGTPRAGRDFIRQARKFGPSRTPTSRAGNIVTKYLSRKMAVRMPAESLHPEFGAIIRYDYDVETLEFYVQPPSRVIDITVIPRGTKADGTPHAPQVRPTSYTADILRIMHAGFLLEEWKTRDDMEQLVVMYPHRFVKTENGFRCPEREAYFARMGIEYSIHTSDENPPLLIQNIEFLADYLAPEAPPNDPSALKLLKGILAQRHTVSLAELLPGITAVEEEDDEGRLSPVQFFGPRLTADQIYKAIADRDVYVDLLHDDLSDHRDTILCETPAHLEFVRASRPVSNMVQEYLDLTLSKGSEVRFGDEHFVVAMMGTSDCVLRDSAGAHHPWKLIDLAKLVEGGQVRIQSDRAMGQVDWAAVDVPNEKQLKEARMRLDLVLASRVGRLTTKYSNRTLSRWRRAVRDAGPSEHQQLLALVSKAHLRGNTKSRMSQETLDVIDELSTADNNPTDPLSSHAYRKYQGICQTRGIRFCSRVAFNREYNKRKSVLHRRGSRVEYQLTPATAYLKRETPINGIRPFQIAHFDHTKLSLYVSVKLHNGKTRKVRPWLSIAIDAATREVIGFYLSVHAPSTMSCMMLCRDIVRRHGRMPSLILVDNGKEFHSWAFDEFLIATRTDLRFRSPHQARFGSVCERLFGTTDKMLIFNLTGNTKAMVHVRTVTKLVNPVNADAPTLPQLHALLDYFFTEVYGNQVHPAIQESPRSYRERRMTETGWRLNRMVKFDARFKVLTCVPPVRDRTRVIDRVRGVKIGHLLYWCPDFANPKLHKKEVEVKIDPWNVAIAYAKVGNEWKKCICKLFAMSKRMTALELRYLMDSMRISLRRLGREVSQKDIERLIELDNLPRNASEAGNSDYDIGDVWESHGMGSTASAPATDAEWPSAAKPAREPSIPPRVNKPLTASNQFPIH